MGDHQFESFKKTLTIQLISRNPMNLCYISDWSELEYDRSGWTSTWLLIVSIHFHILDMTLRASANIDYHNGKNLEIKLFHKAIKG